MAAPDTEVEQIEGAAGPLRVAVVGLGEVGTIFAASLKEAGIDIVLTGLRASARAREAAEQLRLPFQENLEQALYGVDIVMIATVGGVLVDAARRIAPVLGPDTLFVDLTAASPGDVVRASAIVAAGNYIDVAINGAVSLQGMRTPLLAAGARAGELAKALNPLGFKIEAQTGWAVGDASKLKLVRSIFTKGLEVLLIETLLAAETMNIRPAVQEALRDYDASTIKQHTDMYLRTHVPMAERRLLEMQKVLALLEAEGAPTSVTLAAIARYSRSLKFIEASPPSETGAEATFEWLFQAEKNAAEDATRKRRASA